MQDPFFAVREEVEHSLAVVEQLHRKWAELRGAERRTDEFEWTSSELLSGLRSIDWDLQDLEDTVSIVEGSRQKFQLDDGELQSRKAFIESTRQRIIWMRDEVQGPSHAETPSAGFSTKKSSAAIPGVGAKGRGYGEVRLDDDPMVDGDKGVRPMASADGDEILGADLGEIESPQGRHRKKKLCMLLLLVLLVAGGVASTFSKSVSLVSSSPMAPPPSAPSTSSAVPTPPLLQSLSPPAAPDVNASALPPERRRLEMPQRAGSIPDR